ncbi:MAG: hypothetical protein LBE81_12430, partial [Azonexus sp.]|uniref:polymorphic toxin type 15 domain-containing protein n=1 Tax=Azonexus sp. TaxID=1872668 RepID=UPI0028217B39
GETPKSTNKAAAANPPVDETNILEDAQASTKQYIDDWVEGTGYNQGAMVAGAIATAVVEVFMPTAWWELIPIGKAGKILKKGGEALGILKKGEKAVEAAKDAGKAKKAEDAKSGGGGKDTQVKKKGMEKHEVKCFKKNDKGNPKEYDRQLADQEKGLNNLSVKEYLEGRERYAEIGRQGTGAAQQKARTEYSRELTDKFSKELKDQGIFGDAAKEKAAAMAKERMSTLAALHNPDMIAGGKDVVTTMGDKGVNQSIGSQWKDRVAELDKAAKEIPESERGNTKMNAKLKRCK